jgi:hypothetical protein
MASPDGTTINELKKSLSLTRRSVFRMIRTIENEFNIPVTMKREKFGGCAIYCLPKSFVDGLSNIKAFPKALTFEEALVMFLLKNNTSL